MGPRESTREDRPDPSGRAVRAAGDSADPTGSEGGAGSSGSAGRAGSSGSEGGAGSSGSAGSTAPTGSAGSAGSSGSAGSTGSSGSAGSTGSSGSAGSTGSSGEEPVPDQPLTRRELHGRHHRGRRRHPSPATRGAGDHAKAAVKEFFLVIGMALLLSTVAKTFLVQAFFIPSGSMETTLVPDDRVVVNKLVPGVVDLHRGDVVVFEDPGGWLNQPPVPSEGPVLDAVHKGLSFVGLMPSTSEDHLIKRVIGLPGDRVACCDARHRLTVNGVALTEPYVRAGDQPSTMTFAITVPAGKVWVMGDHRSDSEDSRYHDPDGTGAQGSVPVDRITGRAFAVVWPFGHFGGLSDFETTFADVPPAGSRTTSTGRASATSSGP